MGMEESYGQYEEISQDQVKLYLKREFVHMINVDTVFVSLFAMEKRMLAKDAMVLHCSVLKVKSGVILFSGPSGIGKSTQAGLWTKYRKARVINGDRTLLKKENGRWMSLGWPICGSSEICYNEAYPVKAVIFLHKLRIPLAIDVIIGSLVCEAMYASTPKIPKSTNITQVQSARKIELPEILLHFSLLPSPRLLDKIELMPTPVPTPTATKASEQEMPA